MRLHTRDEVDMLLTMEDCNASLSVLVRIYTMFLLLLVLAVAQPASRHMHSILIIKKMLPRKIIKASQWRDSRLAQLWSSSFHAPC